MSTADHAKLDLQAILGVPEEKRAPNIGPLTRELFELLARTPNDAPWPAGDRDPSLAKPGGGARDISKEAIELIKHFESLKKLRPDGLVEAYQDVAGVWTIGWGHTGLQHKDGTVYKGRTITPAKAEQLFRYDMDQFEARVEALCKVPLNDNEFGALVAFDFNTGGLSQSTLLKKLNAGDRYGAANELLKWDKAKVNGKMQTVRGLTRRRHSERRLFLGEKPYVLDLDQLARVERGLPV